MTVDCEFGSRKAAKVGRAPPPVAMGKFLLRGRRAEEAASSNAPAPVGGGLASSFLDSRALPGSAGRGVVRGNEN